MLKPKNTLWNHYLDEEFSSNWFREMCAYVDNERKIKTIYPSDYRIFHALDMCPLYHTKVVILGEEPYPSSVSDGLAFSCLWGTKEAPLALRNVFRAVNRDLGIKNTVNNLNSWAYQGVLLLNLSLTVENNKPGSHKQIGWNRLIERILSLLNSSLQPIVFLLWGKEALKLKGLLDNPEHLVLESSSPTPDDVHQGFLFSKHFSKANDYLVKKGQLPIDWRTK